MPARFGDYVLEEEIGRGGMGVVYRAHQVSLRREVAVKLILKGDLASDAERQRFRREAEAAARLNHPNIVSVIEVGETGGQMFISMRLVTGKTLAQLLAEGPLEPRRSAEIMVAVARAIGFAHVNGFLHRDLKPSNILLGKSGTAYVADFGLAKEQTSSGSLSSTDAVIGTPSYMSPEQAAGARGQVGSASDVYSLGAILYHMITGRPPFQAPTAVDTVMMVLEQDPVPARALNPAVDRSLEMITMRCLQKPQDLRYQSSDALADDLQAFLNDESISASDGRFSQVVASWFRETHHARILENWGLLWMWHSLVLLTACVATNVLLWLHDWHRWHYFLWWTFGFGLGHSLLVAEKANGTRHLCRTSDRSRLGRELGLYDSTLSDRSDHGTAGIDTFSGTAVICGHDVYGQSRHSVREILLSRGRIVRDLRFDGCCSQDGNCTVWVSGRQLLFYLRLEASHGTKKSVSLVVVADDAGAVETILSVVCKAR